MIVLKVIIVLLFILHLSLKQRRSQKMSVQKSRRHRDNIDLPTSQRPCFRHINGNCNAGDDCIFSHDHEICFPKKKPVNETKGKTKSETSEKHKSKKTSEKPSDKSKKTADKSKKTKKPTDDYLNSEEEPESDDEQYWTVNTSKQSPYTDEQCREQCRQMLELIKNQSNPVAAPVAPVQSTAPCFPEKANHVWITGNMNPNDRTGYWFSKLPPDFQQYIQTNQTRFDGMVSHLMDIIFGKVPITSAAAWLKNLGDRKLIDLSNIQNWTSSRNSFTAAFHYGYYLVFKAVYIGMSLETDIGIALLFFAQQFCNYVHVALIPTGRYQEFVGFQFPIQSFEDMSSKVFAGLY